MNSLEILRSERVDVFVMSAKNHPRDFREKWKTLLYSWRTLKLLQASASIGEVFPSNQNQNAGKNRKFRENLNCRELCETNSSFFALPTPLKFFECVGFVIGHDVENTARHFLHFLHPDENVCKVLLLMLGRQSKCESIGDPDSEHTQSCDAQIRVGRNTGWISVELCKFWVKMRVSSHTKAEKKKTVFRWIRRRKRRCKTNELGWREFGLLFMCDGKCERNRQNKFPSVSTK